MIDPRNFVGVRWQSVIAADGVRLRDSEMQMPAGISLRTGADYHSHPALSSKGRLLLCSPLVDRTVGHSRAANQSPFRDGRVVGDPVPACTAGTNLPLRLPVDYLGQTRGCEII